MRLATQAENQHTNSAAVVEPKAFRSTHKLFFRTVISRGIFASASGVFSQAGSVGLGLIVGDGCGVIFMHGALC